MSAQSHIPPGWYPDQMGHVRWWDGVQWGPYAPAPAFVVQPRPLKDTTVAYLLLIFLGGFGAHHFYLGNIGAAVTMLLLWLGGIALSGLGFGLALMGAVAVWWIVDLFSLPTYLRNANARLG